MLDHKVEKPAGKLQSADTPTNDRSIQLTVLASLMRSWTSTAWPEESMETAEAPGEVDKGWRLDDAQEYRWADKKKG